MSLRDLAEDNDPFDYFQPSAAAWDSSDGEGSVYIPTSLSASVASGFGTREGSPGSQSAFSEWHSDLDSDSDTDSDDEELHRGRSRERDAPGTLVDTTISMEERRRAIEDQDADFRNIVASIMNEAYGDTTRIAVGERYRATMRGVQEFTPAKWPLPPEILPRLWSYTDAPDDSLPDDLINEPSNEDVVTLSPIQKDTDGMATDPLMIEVLSEAHRIYDCQRKSRIRPTKENDTSLGADQTSPRQHDPSEPNPKLLRDAAETTTAAVTQLLHMLAAIRNNNITQVATRADHRRDRPMDWDSVLNAAVACDLSASAVENARKRLVRLFSTDATLQRAHTTAEKVTDTTTEKVTKRRRIHLTRPQPQVESDGEAGLQNDHAYIKRNQHFNVAERRMLDRNTVISFADHGGEGMHISTEFISDSDEFEAEVTKRKRTGSEDGDD
ncbi:hypothetical protein BC832DRAFT_590472 [Gaertneriomyces semiglobifer]|nr:hypothetical protein BC832DRAFT_590472 [Gaertneriomyces semiglobifer]